MAAEDLARVLWAQATANWNVVGAQLQPSSVDTSMRAYGVRKVALNPGDTVRVFVKGPPAFVANVRRTFKTTIQPFVNLAFEFRGTRAGANLVIKHGGADGISGVCDCLGCRNGNIELAMEKNRPNRPPRFLVAHEAGHFLGLAHEHSHPVEKLEWIRKEVNKHFGKGAMSQFITEKGPLNVLPFNRGSVMAYDIPARLNKQKVSLKTNVRGFTAMDKLWLMLTYGEPGTGKAGERVPFPAVNDSAAIDALLSKVRRQGKEPSVPPTVPPVAPPVAPARPVPPLAPPPAPPATRPAPPSDGFTGFSTEGETIQEEATLPAPPSDGFTGFSTEGETIQVEAEPNGST